jgi:hypothetical protein
MKNIVAPMYDQGYSALIEDLFQQGMLDDTLVCNVAEFGRTPKVNPAGGRDHWPGCFTCGFAGGGVQGGRVVGDSGSTHRAARSHRDDLPRSRTLARPTSSGPSRSPIPTRGHRFPRNSRALLTDPIGHEPTLKDPFIDRSWTAIAIRCDHLP